MPFFRKCATIFVALFFFSPFVYPDSKQSVPRDVVRFIYKYYYNLPYRSLLDAIDPELQFIYPAIDLSGVNSSSYGSSLDGPGNLVRLIELQIQSQGLIALRDPEDNDVRTESPTDWFQCISKCDLYLLYASDSSSKAESSFGHISLLYKDPDNPYFSRVVTFLAKDFMDPRTGKKSAANYVKGAFGTINGSVSVYPLFDELRSSVLDDNRIIAQYKICVDDSTRHQIDTAVWSDLHQRYAYNFFFHNCSTHIFDLVASACGIENFQTKMTPPAINLRRLCKKNILEYTGAYVRTRQDTGQYTVGFRSDVVYDLSKAVHYQSVTFSQSWKGSDLDFSFFSFNRPFNGIAYQSSNITIGSATFNYCNEEISIKKITPLKIDVSPNVFGGIGVLYRMDAGYNGGGYLQQEAGLFAHYGAFRFEGGYNNGLGNDVLQDFMLRSIISAHQFDASVDVSYQDERFLFDSVSISFFPVSDASLLFRVGIHEWRIGFSLYN